VFSLKEVRSNQARPFFVQRQGREKVIQSENENAAGQIRMTKVTDVVHHDRWKFIDQKIVALYLIFA